MSKTARWIESRLPAWREAARQAEAVERGRSASAADVLGVVRAYPEIARDVAIARALAPSPRLVVLDEPTSGLDQSVRGRIVSLLRELQAETGVAYVFITHDIDVAGAIAHDVAVMKRGRVVELGAAREVLASPRDPYTQALLAAVPTMDPGRRRHRGPADPEADASPTHKEK